MPSPSVYARIICACVIFLTMYAKQLHINYFITSPNGVYALSHSDSLMRSCFGFHPYFVLASRTCTFDPHVQSRTEGLLCTKWPTAAIARRLNGCASFARDCLALGGCCHG